MADLRDDTAIALDNARRLLRGMSRTQDPDAERQFLHQVGEQLALAASGLHEAVQDLQERIDALDERTQ